MSELRNLIELHQRGHLSFAHGEAVFHVGDCVARVHLVVTGEIILDRHSASGVCLVLQRARAGQVIAEPSIFATRYHCSAIAAVASTVVFAPLEAVRSAILSDPAGLQRLACQFARDVQAARFRAEILALRRLPDRLDAWLDLNGGVLPDKGTWLTLAADLAVAPAALYRELAKRRAASQSSLPEKLFRA